MPLEKALADVLSDRTRFGQLLIQRTSSGGFALCHRDDENTRAVEIFHKPDDSIEIARFDDAGKYRPLKTAPNLKHGWRLEVVDLSDLRRALDYFYPGRLAMLAAWKENRLSTTTLRETLDRQSGMYRVAAKISDEQINSVVGNFCRSDGGCLRAILWKRDANGTIPSARLPAAKFDPSHDQTGRGQDAVPLLCQEACNLLVSECRKVVKGDIDE